MLDFNYNCQKNVKMTASTEKALNQNNFPIPPLESGDRLSRQEFEQRYHGMPHISDLAPVINSK
jgi:hypothetical protein